MRHRIDRRLASALAVLLVCAAALWAPAASAQGMTEIPPPERLVQTSVPPVALAAGGTATAKLTLTILPTWHINANPASPDYMVPTEVELTGKAGVTAGAPKYPAAHALKLGFEESTLSVWDGVTVIEIPLRAAASATNGTHRLAGTLEFQACNDQLCLAPARVPFTLEVTVEGGVEGSATAEPAPSADAAPGPPGDTLAATPAADTARGIRTEGFTSGPPAGGALTSRAGSPPANLDGWAGLLLLFGGGLLLNLTPCVFPMLGVTVSLFGARRAAPPAQVLAMAVIYVLGIATMYTVLGVAAALTGSLFGSLLQNPWVLVGTGLVLVALSLSMFGLYEFQMPAVVRERASAVQAVGLAGMYLSGLFVGIFAAPCIGPFVVGLLLDVGARGDVGYGFRSFFTLAMGLGAPYLVLALFSNLLQRLPRSGEWMEWIKRVFGVILFAMGVNYALLGIGPDLAEWVLPITLVAAGVWLGFVDGHADRLPRFRAFKRAAGALAVVGGLAVVALAPKQTLAMQEFSTAGLETALASGKLVMVDFSADWCVPCHELERFTFTDRRVIAAARDLAAFRADLTRYDSPESEAWRRQYAISGVPTVLFLAPDGREVRESRVEGFLPPDRFLERIATAVAAAQRAATPGGAAPAVATGSP